jgi:hypothetical protein
MSRTRVIFTIAAIAIGLSGCAATGTKSASTSVPASTSTGTVDSYTPPTDSDTTTADATEPASQPPNTYNDMPLGRSITVTGTDNNEKPYKVTVTAHAKPKTSKRAVVDYGGSPEAHLRRHRGGVLVPQRHMLLQPLRLYLPRQ